MKYVSFIFLFVVGCGAAATRDTRQVEPSECVYCVEDGVSKCADFAPKGHPSHIGYRARRIIIHRQKQAESAGFNGKNYLFENKMCRDEFLKDPEEFLKSRKDP